METLELLMSKGADVSIIDNEGLTPLDLAQENQQEDCVKMLFKATQVWQQWSTVPPKRSIVLACD